jgi:hypothetical protein
VRRIAIVVSLSWVLVLAATSAGAQCAGDCGADGVVTVDEVITGVNIALGTTSVEQCGVFDFSGDDMVTVDEIITAVNNALNGCPTSQPTPTATQNVPTPTPTSGIISAEMLGTFSGPGVNTVGGAVRQVRIRIEIIEGAIVVTDLNGNLFDSGSTITVMALNPTTLFFSTFAGGRVETLQLGLQGNGDVAGSYANLTTTVPPVGTSIAVVLSPES